ncbi:unnamed protein product [Vitrella brassicaformis CCMP3155]|uniref:Uncharacterized protein n=1 Tax=Vitrella brassicaformis (strain CCMP3155) TaxID=1169540 RepID=A0A0G4EJV1_VITBC|nr:unnamed protein product [Vitrella brassicaformis CCMP3155]|eukprot:CEL97710.1 unnamed protein product [Vitrella brassicaformis CCMP3155]
MATAEESQESHDSVPDPDRPCDDEEPKERAERLKKEGNDLLTQNKFQEAIDRYSEAISLDPANHVLYSNRSAARIRVNALEDALGDAEECVRLKEDFGKGWGRKAGALLQLRRPREALQAVDRGLQVDPGNAFLQGARKEALKQMFLQRLRGKWRGTVSQQMGGYEQVFDFVDDTKMHVSVEHSDMPMDVKYDVDVDQTPHTLQMAAVNMPGMPFPVPPWRGVIRIVPEDDSPDTDRANDQLHVNTSMDPFSPVPSTFEGIGFVSMRRSEGFVHEGPDQDVLSLSEEQQLEKYFEGFIEVLESVEPLDPPMPGDSPEESGAKVQKQVQLQLKISKHERRFSKSVCEKAQVVAKQVDNRDMPSKMADIVKRVRELLVEKRLISPDSLPTANSADNPSSTVSSRKTEERQAARQTEAAAADSSSGDKGPDNKEEGKDRGLRVVLSSWAGEHKAALAGVGVAVVVGVGLLVAMRLLKTE